MVLQAGGNFRIWSSCWSSDELVALSTHTTVIADPCVVGVQMKIHIFNIITTGGKEVGLWNKTKSIVLLFLCCFWHIGHYACWWVCKRLKWCIHLVKLSICMEACWVLLVSDHHSSCFIICDPYISVVDSVFCWHITMWNWQVKDLIYLKLLCSVLYGYLYE